MKNVYSLSLGLLSFAAMAMVVLAGMPSNVVAADPEPTPMEVTLDMKGGSGENKINLKSKGTISVTILATDSFDPANVNPVSVNFGGADSVKWSVVNGNSKKAKDLKLTFNVEQLTLTTKDTTAYLSGFLNDGTPIWGSIAVKIVKS
jgi:hypothetical protein